MVITSSLFFFGYLIHHEHDKSADICYDKKGGDSNHQCIIPSFDETFQKYAYYDIFRLSVATTSFVIATSTRTMILSPIKLLESSISNQILPTQIIHKMNAVIEKLELFSNEIWEDIAIKSNLLREDNEEESSTSSYYHHPPEIDLNVFVPCEEDVARVYISERQRRKMSNNQQENDNDIIDGGNACRLRDVITQNLLVEYAKVIDVEFDLASHPIILRNLWPPETFNDNERRLTPNGIMNDPQLSNLILPNYFSDATKYGYDALKPDVLTKTTLSEFLEGILSGNTPNAKIGSQVIVDQIPELRNEIIPASMAKNLFGWNTYLEDAKKSLHSWLGDTVGGWIDKILPPMSYFPVFIASNQQSLPGAINTHLRTDLHMEPIGNIAAQLHGTRQWTLVPTTWSKLLRPTVSKDRGYFYSNIDPALLHERLSRIPVVYNCTTRKGDVIWIPPWTWHRVDYDGEYSEESLSIGASIFHFFPKLYMTSNPLFSLLILPNLIQEVLGFNIE